MFDLLDINPKLVFILMPFAPRFDDVFKACIVPAVKRCHLTPVRADDLTAGVDILRGIYRNIASSRVIIADMTGRNPNVFFELGIAHALGKDIVLLTNNRKTVPFDLLTMRNIEYRSNVLHKLTDDLYQNLRALTHRV